MIPSALHAVWAIRAVVVVATGWVLALTWHKRFLDHYEKFALFIPVVWAAGIEAMLFLAAPGDPARHVYYAGLILVVIGFHTFIYLPILPMIAISAGIAAIYAYIGLAAHDMARLGDLPTLVANLFFLVSAVILCGAGQARRYRYLLENFRWRHTLARDVAEKEQARRQSERQASHDPDYSPYLRSPTPRCASIASTKSAARCSPIHRVWGPGKPSDLRPRKPPRPATMRTI